MFSTRSIQEGVVDPEIAEELGLTLVDEMEEESEDDENVY